VLWSQNGNTFICKNGWNFYYILHLCAAIMGSVANPFLISGLMLEPMSTGRIKRVTKTHVLIQTPNLKPQTSNFKLHQITL
jgi:hypothetical protein